MKKIILIACLLIQFANAQNNYGEFTYPHSGASILSSGITSTVAGQPGFIMAGYDPIAAGFNFTIDRTDLGGAFTGSTYEFQKQYNLFADVSGACNPGITTPVMTNHGVSIIQTPLSVIGARYALVGAFDEGCFLCFIDGSGTVINTNVFWFPFPAGINVSSISKPIIKEDPANLGNYFICGSYDGIMYIMNIDYNGITNWTNLYSIDGQPADMILNSGGDPVIVGQTTKIRLIPDGFFMTLSGASGGFVNFEIYDYNNYRQQFSCITAVSGGNYVIGGQCEISPGIAKAYNVKVNGGGSIFWDNAIYSNADATAGNFVGIVERNSTAYSAIEYFGVMTSTVGIIVSRMDANGVPTWVGPTPPAPSSSRLDEFVYNAPGTNLSATGISYRDIPSTYDEGLHIFGTDYNSGIATPYLAQSYFDGHSGCNIPAFHFFSFSTLCTSTPKFLVPVAGLSPCNAINIQDAIINSKTDYCGPYNSIANSSNNKTTSVSKTDGNLLNKVYFSTDPQNSEIRINGIESSKILEIAIYNVLGQKLYSKTAQTCKTENSSIVCSNLDLTSGSYLITVSCEDGIISKRVLYSKE